MANERTNNHLDVSSIVIVALDLDGDITLINNAGCRLLGHDKRELLGKNWFDLCLPIEIQKDVKAVFNSIIKGHMDFNDSYENVVITRKSEKKLISWHHSSLVDDADNIVGTLSSGYDVTQSRDDRKKLEFFKAEWRSITQATHDITAKKRAESELVLLQGQLNRVLQDQLDRVLTLSTAVIYTRKASANYAPTFMGERIQSQLGYLPIDFTDDPNFWINHIHPDDKEHVLSDLSEIDKQEEHIQEYRFRHKNGNYLWMHDEFRVSRDAGNKPLEFIGAWVDITKNKMYEENLKQDKSYSEAANKAKSAFLAVIGHELRTPLNVVLGMSNILLKGELTNQQQEDVSTILTAAGELQRIIGDIMDYVRLESGGIRLKHEVFAVNGTIVKIAKRFRPLAEAKNLQFDVNISGNVPRHCVGDEGRIIQILNNIIGNAIKFTNHGGVDINVDAETITETRIELIITIEDTGIGIESDKYSLIFNKFTQVDSSRSRSHGGIGLGLSIARELTEMMAGIIALYSAPGKGSTFIVRLGLELPQGDVGYKKIMVNEVSTSNYSGLRVLVVEDDRQQQVLLQELLKKLGCKVVVAWGGKEALSLFDHNYDIIFTDIAMPGMDGYELSKKLRQRMTCNKPIPIIGITAICQEDDEIIRESELNACISKPVNSEAIKTIFATFAKPNTIIAGAARDRFNAASMAAPTPLVGRDEEMKSLLGYWSKAITSGQVVMLTGEAGVGKTRLLDDFQDQLASVTKNLVEFHCERGTQNSAFSPVIEYLKQRLQFSATDSDEDKLNKLEATFATRVDDPCGISVLASLLSLPTGDQQILQKLGPEEQKKKTQEVLLQLLYVRVEEKPVLLVVEDLHWADPSTLALLQLLIESGIMGPIMLLMTARPGISIPWSENPAVTHLNLGRLGAADVRSMIEAISGTAGLSDSVIRGLIEKADGIPLFVEESTKMMLDSGSLVADSGECVATTDSSCPEVPDTVQDLLMTRLDRLGHAKAIAQAGAVMGGKFNHECICSITHEKPHVIKEALDRLQGAGWVQRNSDEPESEYSFKHALIRDAAYHTLLERDRRQFHLRIAQAMEDNYRLIRSNQPELIAEHYMQAGLKAKAVEFWIEAGESAVLRSAHVEAVHHLKQGLALLQDMPEGGEGEERKLCLLTLLGGALTATQGYGAREVEHTFIQARELSLRKGDIPRLCQSLSALYRCYIVRVDLPKALELGQQILATAEECQGNVDLLLEAERALGSPLFFLGRHLEARAHFEQGLRLYNPKRHQAHMHRFATDPGIACAAGLIMPLWLLWLLGYPDQALAKGRDTVASSQALGHPFSQVHALVYMAWLHSYRREWQPVQVRTPKFPP